MITPVNIAYYEKKDWEYLLSLISDKEKMPASWDDWYINYQKVKTNLIGYGFLVREITIDIQELMAYCIKRKIKIDGSARAQFVQTK